MLTSLQVAGGAGMVSVLTMVAAWGQTNAQAPWARTVTGQPYRHQVLEVKASAPRAVRFAVAFAWVVVAVSALRACVLLLEILALQVVKIAGAASDCATFPCEPPVASIPPFDALSAGLFGLYLIATGAVIGAFARWARDAAQDMNQARRSAPVLAGAALVVAAGLASRGQHFFWQVGLLHVGVVLLGAAAVAVARDSATERAPA